LFSIAKPFLKVKFNAMSKAEILAELPKLKSEDRREIFERIGEMEDSELIRGGVPTDDEKALLDRELEEFHKNPDSGSPWEDVESRLSKNATT
jgi:putative addiction module component (TIGR02574 family)